MSVKIRKVKKNFGDFTALKEIDLEINDGEFVSLLGPSGCGKTTTLKIIAGFLHPDEGQLFFDDKIMNNIPPEKRPTGLVFQNYALWPHMTIYQNIAFGLKIKKMNKGEIDKRVDEVLEMVGLEQLKTRYPRELSGGQQQRVALARAIAVEPEILLLDEPLSNLDAKIRQTMRFEIKRIQRAIGTTMVYVTHDQEEALAISDRIVVMNHGTIEQIGTPQEIYANPASRFVADFIGSANQLLGVVKEIENEVLYIEVEGLGTIKAKENEEIQIGDNVVVCVRPEDINIVDESIENSFKMKVHGSAYLGQRNALELQYGENKKLRVDTHAKNEQFDLNRTIAIRLPEDMKIFKNLSLPENECGVGE